MPPADKSPMPQQLTLFLFARVLKFVICFPHFSLIARVLQKLKEDKAEALLIAPVWPTQSWWPGLLHLIYQPCFRRPKVDQCLYLPHKPGVKHRLTKMSLGAFRISGQPPIAKVFQKSTGCHTQVMEDKTAAQNSNIIAIFQKGSYSVGKTLIPFHPQSTKF